MKSLSLLLFAVVLATACGLPPEHISTQTATAAATTITPSSTVTPTVVPTLTPTRTLTPTITPTIGPVLLKFDIAEGVSDRDVKVIQEGINFVQAHIEDMFGGAISSAAMTSLTVRVIASGSGGVCCTASGARLLFDVQHPDWISNSIPPGPWSGTENLQKIAAHEYVHAWQHSLGCLTSRDQLLGNWLTEGIAEYIAYDTMISIGHMTSKEARAAQLRIVIDSGALDYPLAGLRGPESLWPGHVGHLAVERLVAKSELGSLSLRIVCEEIGAGVPAEKAFENAFWITEDEFYNQFPAYIDSLR